MSIDLLMTANTPNFSHWPAGYIGPTADGPHIIEIR